MKDEVKKSNPDVVAITPEEKAKQIRALRAQNTDAGHTYIGAKPGWHYYRVGPGLPAKVLRDLARKGFEPDPDGVKASWTDTGKIYRIPTMLIEDLAEDRKAAIREIRQINTAPKTPGELALEAKLAKLTARVDSLAGE